MGPLDRYAFGAIVSIALHTTLAVVSAIIAALLASARPELAVIASIAAVANAAWGLRKYLRLASSTGKQSAH